MQTISVTSTGATVELSKQDLAILANVGVEVFGGALNVSESHWESVPMPSTRQEAKDLLLEFVPIYSSVKSA